MPRIRQNADIYHNEGFRREVLVRLAYLGIQQRDLAEHLGVCDGTVSVMLKNPEKIQVERLRKMIDYLQLEPHAILRFMGYREIEISKRKEDNDEQ